MKAYFFILLTVLTISSGQVAHAQLTPDFFAWKTFDDTLLDQSVDLRYYTSPNTRAGQDSARLVIVCASGGGARAAAFNIGIMLELERILYTKDGSHEASRNVLNEIDYFSTVSGGGWGVSSFIAYRYQEQKYSMEPYASAIRLYNSSQGRTADDSIRYYPSFGSFGRFLSNRSDYRYFRGQIGRIFWMRAGHRSSDMKMTNRLNAGYLGWSYRHNEVEKKLATYLNRSGAESETDEVMLGDVFKPKGQPTSLPMLITNTTNIDNYKLVPFTPDRLLYWGVTGYTHYVLGDVSIDVPSRIESYADIPLASGTKASSGIPFAVSPSTFSAKKFDPNFDTSFNYFLHLQDGGIVDQQAMHSAKAILRHHADIPERKNRIVIVVDASGSGIENQPEYRKRRASRFYNLSRVMAPFSTPDSQYGLTRERIKLLQNEYNCNVIYLGTEVLLDKSRFFRARAADAPGLPRKEKAVRRYFLGKYPLLEKDVQGVKNLDYDERVLLYTYIKSIATWFSSKGSKSGGSDLDEVPQSTANTMFLAGRAVVQLKREQIIQLFNGN